MRSHILARHHTHVHGPTQTCRRLRWWSISSSRQRGIGCAADRHKSPRVGFGQACDFDRSLSRRFDKHACLSPCLSLMRLARPGAGGNQRRHPPLITPNWSASRNLATLWKGLAAKSCAGQAFAGPGLRQHTSTASKRGTGKKRAQQKLRESGWCRRGSANACRIDLVAQQ